MSDQSISRNERTRSRVKVQLRSLLWAPLKKIAYYCFLVLAVALILVAINFLAELVLKRTHLSEIYPDNFAMARRDLTLPVSHYDYDLTPGVCLIQNLEKGARFEYANNAGFRDPRVITVKKPENEFRIFLTGGSTAFGLGATGSAAAITGYHSIEQRETIAHVIEKILNASAPIQGKTIRVYNAAVWGYSYQHLLMRYISKLRRYSPDLVVSLDGANEIHPVSIPMDDWNYFDQGQYNSILRQIFSFDGAGLSSYLTLWLKNNTFIMTLLWQGSDIFQNLEGNIRFHKGSLLYNFQSAQETNPIDQELRSQMVTDNVSAVIKVIDDYHNALNVDGVPHIFALQPMLYSSQKPRHEMERKIEASKDHETYYDLNTGQLYTYLTQRIISNAREKGIHTLNFKDYFNDTSEWVFTDWCHLTPGANYLLGREIAVQIMEHYFGKPLDKNDQMDNKNSFFWNLALGAKIIYAPESDKPSNSVSNILIPYPTGSVYSSVLVPADKPLELTLDLGQSVSFTRFRVFWANDSSVPKTWDIDVSNDMVSWTTWKKGSDDDVDSLSVWPAFDFYSANPIEARYIRYKPTDPEMRSISLRSVGVFR